ncbi:MAG: uL22 family ribosomal protein [Candidatus Peribacteria bacterium]|jgi:large subunit ribosomal protein L22|nr:uL22 family ribosomal protein [Candidatus Peribacteria bacterium]
MLEIIQNKNIIAKINTNMKAYGKNIRISPKKLRVIAEIIRNNDAGEALKFLKYAPKK